MTVANSQLVLFGGYDAAANGGRLHHDVDVGWHHLDRAVTGHQPTRQPQDASMAYDPATGQLVLFGGVGQGQSGILGDTWTWDGTTWTRAVTPPRAPRRGQARPWPMTRLPSQLVLFGGGGPNGDLADTWTWDGTTWTQQTPATSPSPRLYASLGL